MASGTASLIQKLIKDSKKLTDANVKKCKNERILKELTLFQNLSTLCKRDDCKSLGLKKIFKVSLKVLPSPLKLGSARCNENVVISIENISKSFIFSPNYWQIIVDFENGKQVSFWSFENSFEPGSVECISLNFLTNPNFSPVQLNIGLLFSMPHLDSTTFIKSLDIFSTPIDILFLLSPSRIACANMCDNNYGNLEVKFPYSSSAEDENSTNKNKRYNLDSTIIRDDSLPSVTQFFFKLNPPLLKRFCRLVLLNDCKDRWLSVKSESKLNELSSSSNFSVFYLEEKIEVAVRTEAVSFKSHNSRLLSSLKTAILRRLVMLDKIRVNCPSDSACEKLYALKLRLESISKPARVKTETEIKDYMDIFLDLRDVSEAIEFTLDDIVDELVENVKITYETMTID